MLRILYEQNDYPVLQNRVYGSVAEARQCPSGDIKIVEDMETGLIYNAGFRPELMKYNSSYNNEQALSPHFRSHLDRVAGIIEQYLERSNLVEVGCGKGFFLEMLLERKFDVMGFDPAYEGENPRVVKEYFRPSVMKPSRGLILRHVLEHVPDPVGFLRQLRDANGGSGLIYIEVPCFDWICEKRAWFDIFYEHVNYFRMHDFQRMFGHVVASGRLFGNQYLYVVADLGTLNMPAYAQSESIDFPGDFLRSLTHAEQGGTEYTCVWGGASKGVIFSLMRERIGKPVSTVIDVNPAKQGKFLPATGLQVQSPSEALAEMPAGATIYVMNSNYLEEIRAASNHLFNYVGIDQ